MSTSSIVAAWPPRIIPDGPGAGPPQRGPIPDDTWAGWMQRPSLSGGLHLPPRFFYARESYPYAPGAYMDTGGYMNATRVLLTEQQVAIVERAVRVVVVQSSDVAEWIAWEGAAVADGRVITHQGPWGGPYTEQVFCGAPNNTIWNLEEIFGTWRVQYPYERTRGISVTWPYPEAGRLPGFFEASRGPWMIHEGNVLDAIRQARNAWQAWEKGHASAPSVAGPWAPQRGAYGSGRTILLALRKVALALERGRRARELLRAREDPPLDVKSDARIGRALADLSRAIRPYLLSLNQDKLNAPLTADYEELDPDEVPF